MGPSPPAADSAPLPQVPDHQLLRCFGRGSYGEVWLARNVMGTYRAVKIVHRKSFDNDRPYEREFDGIQKFEPVSRSHEGLVDILHVGRNDPAGYFYYVMELADDAVGESEKAGKRESEQGPAPVPPTPPLSHLPAFSPAAYNPRTLASDLKHHGRLPPNDCIQIGLALARALRYLHEQGLVHRDIKPSNIIFVRGVAKLADIGLVCGTEATHSYVGTEGFIPPEGPGTPQADIYSLGKVFYEMSTGKDRQDFPDLPTDLRGEGAEREGLLELNEVLLKACASETAKRYRTAQEMEAELALLQSGQSVKGQRTRQRRMAVAKVIALAAVLIFGCWAFIRFEANRRNVTATAEPRSIAVLPFLNEKLTPDDEYLTEGIPDSIISSLTQVPGLKVAARNSSFAFKGTNGNRRRIGEQLKVRALLEGSVQKVGNRLHVTAQLINTADDYQLMFEPYDREIKDLLTIHSDIAHRVAEALKIPLGKEASARVAQRPTESPEAFRLYVQGRVNWNHRAEGKLKKALQCFKDAIELDPAFALAYSGLADSYSSLVFTYDAGSLSPTNAMPQAQSAAYQALKFGSDLAECQTSQAFVKLIYEWKWQEAESAFTNAIGRNPDYAHAHHWYSHYLMAMGQTNQSLVESQKALKLEPGDFIINIHLGWHYLFTRDSKLALKQFDQTRAMYPDNPLSHRYLGLVHEQLGDFDRAIAEFKRAAELSPTNSIMLGGLGHVLAMAGRRSEAQKLLDELTALSKEKYVSPYYLALIHAGLDEQDEAFVWLDRAFAEKCDALIYLRQDPWLDNLRGDKRFEELVKNVGLPK